MHILFPSYFLLMEKSTGVSLSSHSRLIMVHVWHCVHETGEFEYFNNL